MTSDWLRLIVRVVRFVPEFWTVAVKAPPRESPISVWL